MKLGILGGTFDPIHFGHLRTAEEVAQELNLEKVFLIPSASPPHKQDWPVSPFAHRFEMAKLGARISPVLEVLDVESKREGPSYSIETLKELSHTITDAELFFIIGMDAFLEIHTWKHYRDLFKYANFTVIARPGFSSNQVEQYMMEIGIGFKKTSQSTTYDLDVGKKILFMNTTLLDISSTRIRKLVYNGKSIRFLVPNSVNNYILTQNLYRKK